MNLIFEWLNVNKVNAGNNNLMTWTWHTDQLESDLCRVYIRLQSFQKVLRPAYVRGQMRNDFKKEEKKKDSWVTGLAAWNVLCTKLTHQKKTFNSQLGSTSRTSEVIFDWSQLSVSVTWILLPDGKHNLLKLPLKGFGKTVSSDYKKRRQKSSQWHLGYL